MQEIVRGPATRRLCTAGILELYVGRAWLFQCEQCRFGVVREVAAAAELREGHRRMQLWSGDWRAAARYGTLPDTPCEA